MKKLLAIALAVVMVLALSVSAFAAETVVYKMADTDTLGQLLEDVAIGAGTPITIDHDEYGVGARIATNWVNGSTWDSILAAVKTDGAVLKLTYTGEITAIGFQTDAGGDEFTAITDVTVVDGKNVAIVPCADIVANAPNAASGDFGGWGNFIAQFNGEIAFYGLEFVTGYEAAAAAPADETPADTTPADTTPADTTPADTTPAPAAPAASSAPKTGIALAVVPAVMALAAVAVSKKH